MPGKGGSTLDRSAGPPPGGVLDRDGVLNDAVVRDGKPYPPSSLDELVIAADALDALRRLRRRGIGSWS